jgi:hypothetical protein
VEASKLRCTISPDIYLGEEYFEQLLQGKMEHIYIRYTFFIIPTAVEIIKHIFELSYSTIVYALLNTGAVKRIKKFFIGFRLR